MAEIVRCPACNKKLKVPSKVVSRGFHCPECGQAFPAESGEASPQVAVDPASSPVDGSSTAEDAWFVDSGDRLLGPYPWQQLRDMCVRGLINETTMVGISPQGPWQMAGLLPDLFPDEIPAGEGTAWDARSAPWSGMGGSPTLVDRCRALLPSPVTMDAAFFRVSIALLIVAILSSMYTAISGISIVLSEQVRAGPVVRSAYLLGKVGSFVWLLYIIATLGLMTTLFALRSAYGEIDRRQMIISTAIAIPAGLALLAAFAFAEIKTVDPFLIFDAMEVLKDKQLYTNLFVMTLSILGLMLVIRHRLENWQPIASAAVAPGVFYFLLVLSGMTNNTTPGLIVAMILLTTTFWVNFFIYSSVGRATKRTAAAS